jgi:hypothetical protein
MLAQVCPPGTGGVRDYADCLRQAWATCGLASELIEAWPASAAQPSLATRLSALVPDDASTFTVIVHFSGYGYAARGLCQWLVDELGVLKTRYGGALRVLVMFHELFATGWPWRSAFWLAPLQSSIARQLAHLADAVWTNTEQHAGWLRGATGGGKPLHVRPVFSNVGEPVDLLSWEARQPQVVVFGSAITRQRALSVVQAHERALIRLGISELVEVGDGPSQCVGRVALSTRHLGRLSALSLSALLRASRFGLLEYPARYLGKSGVFAAYAAHGCVALNLSRRRGDADGLRAGTHYLDLGRTDGRESGALKQTSRCLARWYGGHSLALQAQELLQAADVQRCGLPAASEPA